VKYSIRAQERRKQNADQSLTSPVAFFYLLFIVNENHVEKKKNIKEKEKEQMSINVLIFCLLQSEEHNKTHSGYANNWLGKIT
jgi:hypothetical protein